VCTKYHNKTPHFRRPFRRGSIVLFTLQTINILSNCVLSFHASNGEILLLELGDGKTTEVDTDDFNFRSLPLDKGVSLTL